MEKVHDFLLTSFHKLKNKKKNLVSWKSLDEKRLHVEIILIFNKQNFFV